MDDEMKRKAEQASGAAKRKAGEAKDDPDKQAEGRFDESKAQAKEARDKGGDTFGNLKEGVRDKARKFLDRDKK